MQHLEIPVVIISCFISQGGRSRAACMQFFIHLVGLTVIENSIATAIIAAENIAIISDISLAYFTITNRAHHYCMCVP